METGSEEAWQMGADEVEGGGWRFYDAQRTTSTQRRDSFIDWKDQFHSQIRFIHSELRQIQV